MRALGLILPALGVLVATVAVAADKPRLSTRQLQDWINHGPYMGSQESGLCEWGGGESIGFQFNYTNKGNGTLSIGGQDLRIYDASDDGCYFESDRGVLRIDLSVVNKTPLLILSGMARWEDDKGKAVIRREPILVIFALNKQKRLELVTENEGALHAGVIGTDDPTKKRKEQSEWTEIIQHEAEKAPKKGD